MSGRPSDGKQRGQGEMARFRRRIQRVEITSRPVVNHFMDDEDSVPASARAISQNARGRAQGPGKDERRLSAVAGVVFPGDPAKNDPSPPLMRLPGPCTRLVHRPRREDAASARARNVPRAAPGRTLDLSKISKVSKCARMPTPPKNTFRGDRLSAPTSASANHNCGQSHTSARSKAPLDKYPEPMNSTR